MATFSRKLHLININDYLDPPEDKASRPPTPPPGQLEHAHLAELVSTRKHEALTLAPWSIVPIELLEDNAYILFPGHPIDRLPLSRLHYIGLTEFVDDHDLQALERQYKGLDVGVDADELAETPLFRLDRRTEILARDGQVEVEPQWIKCDMSVLDLSALGKSDVIIVDPPWTSESIMPWEFWSDHEIRNLQIDNLLQTGGLVFLWVPLDRILLGFEYLEHWGCTQTEMIVWIKIDGLDRTEEYCLMGMKGVALNNWVRRGECHNLIVSRIQKEHQKPGQLYEMIDRMGGVGVRKLELFGRRCNIRPGWLTVGKQLPPTYLYEPELIKLYQEYIQITGEDSTYNPKASSMDWRQKIRDVLPEEMASPEKCEGPVDNTGIDLDVASAVPTFDEYIAALGQSGNVTSPPTTDEDAETFNGSLSREPSTQFQAPELDDDKLPEFFIPSIEGDNTVNRIEDYLIHPGEMEPRNLKTHKEHLAESRAVHRARGLRTKFEIHKDVYTEPVEQTPVPRRNRKFLPRGYSLRGGPIFSRNR
ncbi:N6-adenosine-methyltransferase subunit mettl3 [Rhizina undulata]